MQSPMVEFRDGVYYVVLDAATPHGRGVQHGLALRLPIRRTLAQFKRWIRNEVGLDDPNEAIAEFVASSTHLEAVREDAPDLYEEMEGIAEAAGVDLVELFTYQSFDEFFMHLVNSGTLDLATSGHCTTAAACGRSGLPNLVAHNNDIPTYHESAVTVLHIRPPDDDLEILQGTFAGQIAQNGVNSTGVAVGVNTIADLPGGSGLPVSFHVRRILQTRSLDDALEYLASARFGQAMNYMIADRTGAASVETWPGNTAVLDAADTGYLAHTNHALAPDVPTLFELTAESGGGSYGFTHQRLDLANKTLSEKINSINFDGFRQLFTTRPVLVYPGKPTGRTIMSMIVEIPASGTPTLHLTPDSPSIYDHARFSFG
jgi:isopenicillin-N N-acyltransferase-like protein